MSRRRNWWVRLIVETWSDADYVWAADRERVTMGYQTEQDEYALDNPRPTLKATMIGLKGCGAR